MNMALTVIMQLTGEYVHISIIDPITIITNAYSSNCYYAVNWRDVHVITYPPSGKHLQMG